MDNDQATILVEQAPDAFIFAGTDGNIVTWNEGAAQVFGFSAAEAIGQSLDIIIPERFRERHWTGYDRALAAGETKYKGEALPTRAQKSDGSTLYVELTFAIVKGADGTVLGASAIARDITERFLRDREQAGKLRDLQAELETLRAGAGSSTAT